MKIDRAITIYRPRAEVYQFWRTFENLPRFMRHLESVRNLDGSGQRTHWVAKAPLDTTVEWDAEIVTERDNELISWQALPDSQIDNRGSVAFRDAPGSRGTEVTVNLVYDAPGGKAGALIARLLGEEPEVQIRDDLRRLKQILEVGWVTTVDGQTSGRKDEEETQEQDQNQGGQS
jgi:uncharacterized membrane protein